MTNQPLVSCLCASRPERWGLLQRAILDYTRQVYPYRELIVVVPQHTDYANLVQGFVDHLASETPTGLPTIKVFARSAHSGGDCLLHAMAHCRGEVICLWDDDNLNHPDRLVRQVQLQERFAQSLTVCSRVLYLFYDSRELFIVDHVDPRVEASERVAATTLMGPRDLWPPFDLHQRSDTSRALVGKAVSEGTRITPIAILDLYHMVGVAADTVRGYEEHRKIAQTRSLPAATMITRQSGIVAALDAYYWDAGDITVAGRDGSAFTYTPKNLNTDLYPIKIKDDDVEAITEQDE